MLPQPHKRTKTVHTDGPVPAIGNPPTRSNNVDYELLQSVYPEIDVPSDISPASFDNAGGTHAGTRSSDAKNPYAESIDLSSFFASFESSAPTVEANVRLVSSPVFGNGGVPIDPSSSTAGGAGGAAETPSSRTVQRRKDGLVGRKKREPTQEDRTYRSDREFVKRRSHQKMIWFFRRLNIRHPAAIRTHLERVKHTEFELPGLQCVYPHHGLSVACDENDDASVDRVGSKGGRTAKNAESATANLSYYNLYCATPALVDRIRVMMGGTGRVDPDYNKKIVAFVADIVGRLLWHSNRTHAVMFAKSDHVDRECFLLYSRQVEPTPFVMRSDSFYCRRHDTDRFRCLAPQPDLTRANSARVSNESSIYIVGCEFTEIWSEFPYEYRLTRCRPMKSLSDRVSRIDAAVLDHVFSPLNAHINGDRERSPYVEVASSTSFDLLSVLLRNPDSKEAVADDSAAHREHLERFITAAVMNVHAMLGIKHEEREYGGYRDTDARRPPTERLRGVVLHHVNYRREIRTLRTNRVYYYRNRDDYVCSHSLLDDRFEDRRVVDDREVAKRRPVYFYDLVQPFEYDRRSGDVNHIALHVWEDAIDMIRESAHTISRKLTPDVLRNPPPDDPFYPPSDMSAIDLAIDQMLERAIKHSKKIKLPASPTSVRHQTRNRGHTAAGGPAGDRELALDSDQNFARGVISRSMSKIGENRMRDGYSSPTRQDYERTFEFDGAEIPVRIRVGPGERPPTRVEFDATPVVRVYDRLICAYMIDPNDAVQVRVVPGSHVTDLGNPSHVRLRIDDRIVRVFCVQHLEGSFVIRPFVYLVFRNMPYAEIGDDVLDEVFRDTLSYEGFGGFRAFDGPRRGDRVSNTRRVQPQPVRNERTADGDHSSAAVHFGFTTKEERGAECGTDGQGEGREDLFAALCSDAGLWNAVDTT